MQLMLNRLGSTHMHQRFQQTKWNRLHCTRPNLLCVLQVLKLRTLPRSNHTLIIAIESRFRTLESGTALAALPLTPAFFCVLHTFAFDVSGSGYSD